MKILINYTCQFIRSIALGFNNLFDLIASDLIQF